MTTQSFRNPRLVRIALRIFPAAFRARYGHELWLCIRDARRDFGNESFGATVRFWTLILADLARSALIERCRSIPRGFWPFVLRRTAGALLIAAAVANVAYDVVSIKLSMGVFTALLTAASAIAGTLLIRSGPRRVT
jgi:hypothetical protein